MRSVISISKNNHIWNFIIEFADSTISVLQKYI